MKPNPSLSQGGARICIVRVKICILFIMKLLFIFLKEIKMEVNKLEGKKYFLDLKKNYQYINEKIRRLYLGVDSLTEEILIIESKHQNIFDENSYQNKIQLTYVEYIQSKNYINRIKDYI